MDYSKIKAVFFDIDGTLISFKTHKVPQSTIDAVRAIRDKGIKVFIATGRPVPFISNLGGLDFDGIMAVNGAYCIDNNNNVLCNHPVPKEDIERLIADSKNHTFPIAFAGNEKAIISNVDANRKNVEEIFGMLGMSVPEERPITDALNMEVMQVIAFFDNEEQPRIMHDVLKNCDGARWHPYFVDCINKGTSKATGIDVICQHYGIDISETMAFGDGGNDVQMLEHAGIGVAMGNASDEVKKYADIVTTSVDENGVANILSKL